MRSVVEIEVMVSGVTYRGHYSVHREGLVVSLEGAGASFYGPLQGDPKETACVVLRNLVRKSLPPE